MHRLVCEASECGYDRPLPMGYLDALVWACISDLDEATVFVPPPRSTEEETRRNRKGADVRRRVTSTDNTIRGRVLEIEISVIP
jgi:hypothetical protein